LPSINENGEFESPIPSDNRRFFTMLGTLVGGRIGIPRSALAAAKSGLTIAIKYSDQHNLDLRRIRSSNIKLVSINADYSVTGKTYAIHFALQYVTIDSLIKANLKMQEIPSAGNEGLTLLGAQQLFYRNVVRLLVERGYLSENRIDVLKIEIDTTFGGDNTKAILVAKKSFIRIPKIIGKWMQWE
jgi:acyl-CoA oxidase